MEHMYGLECSAFGTVSLFDLLLSFVFIYDLQSHPFFYRLDMISSQIIASFLPGVRYRNDCDTTRTFDEALIGADRTTIQQIFATNMMSPEANLVQEQDALALCKAALMDFDPTIQKTQRRPYAFHHPIAWPSNANVKREQDSTAMDMLSLANFTQSPTAAPVPNASTFFADTVNTPLEPSTGPSFVPSVLPSTQPSVLPSPIELSPEVPILIKNAASGRALYADPSKDAFEGVGATTHTANTPLFQWKLEGIDCPNPLHVEMELEYPGSIGMKCYLISIVAGRKLYAQIGHTGMDGVGASYQFYQDQM